MKELGSNNIPKEELKDIVAQHFATNLQPDNDEVIKNFLAIPKDNCFDETTKRKTFKMTNN